MNAQCQLDKKAVRNSFARAAEYYDSVAALQRQVGDRLYATIKQTTLAQSTVVDIGCGTGFLTSKLSQHCGRLLALDIALPMLWKTRAGLLDTTSIEYLCADAENLPLLDNSIDCIAANLALQWCQNLERLFSEFQRVLTSAGDIHFSTFGPGTLKELKSAWATVDNYPHVNHFYTSTEIEQVLTQLGFHNIQAQSEIRQVNYPSVQTLMRELKGIGAQNVNQGRFKALVSKSRMQKMLDSYELLRINGTIPASFEIIYIEAHIDQ